VFPESFEFSVENFRCFFVSVVYVPASDDILKNTRLCPLCTLEYKSMFSGNHFTVSYSLTPIELFYGGIYTYASKLVHLRESFSPAYE